jgi:hypothetical protein
MTRSLRTLHRRVLLILALAVPLVFLAALLARREIPVMPADVNLATPSAPSAR